jgi:spermidine synthase
MGQGALIPASGSERLVLDRRETPRGVLQLQCRRLPDGEDAVEMIVNGVFLMASYNQASERALAWLALPDAAHAAGQLRVLVGGLGMGFTLHHALNFPFVVAVDVVELEAAVVEWNRGLLSDFNGHCLSDPRVHVVTGDVVEFVRTAVERYDAVCLDVDNGPGWLSQDANARLYTLKGLESVRRILAADGRLAIWSAAAAPRLEARLRRLFRHVERHAVRESDPWGHRLTASVYVATNGPPRVF